MGTIRNYIICVAGGLLIGIVAARKYYPRVETKIEQKTDVQTKTVTVREVLTKQGDVIKETISQDARVTESTKSVTAPPEKLWKVDILQFSDNSKELHVSKKVIGNISVGGSFNTKGTLGVSIGLSF